MNKEIETQYEKILNCSTVTNLRKIEDELLMTRMLLINYHNICFNLKQALNEIRNYILELDDETDNSIYDIESGVRNEILKRIDERLDDSND